MTTILQFVGLASVTVCLFAPFLLVLHGGRKKGARKLRTRHGER